MRVLLMIAVIALLLMGRTFGADVPQRESEPR